MGWIQYGTGGGRLEGDVGRGGDFENGLVAGDALPGGADGFDGGLIFRGVGVDDDEDLGAEADGLALLLALPLAVDVLYAEAVGEAGGDLVVEEAEPLDFGDAFAGWFGGGGGGGRGLGVGGLVEAEAEEELGGDPSLGGVGVGRVAGEGRSGCGSLGVEGEGGEAEDGGKGEAGKKAHDEWLACREKVNA